jgi:vacuolar-type H+-ATPase subunit I/STV1
MFQDSNRNFNFLESNKRPSFLRKWLVGLGSFMMSNATFNNISAISWQLVLLVVVVIVVVGFLTTYAISAYHC